MLFLGGRRGSSGLLPDFAVSFITRWIEWFAAGNPLSPCRSARGRSFLASPMQDRSAGPPGIASSFRRPAESSSASPSLLCDCASAGWAHGLLQMIHGGYKLGLDRGGSMPGQNCASRSSGLSAPPSASVLFPSSAGQRNQRTAEIKTRGGKFGLGPDRGLQMAPPSFRPAQLDEACRVFAASAYAG